MKTKTILSAICLCFTLLLLTGCTAVPEPAPEVYGTLAPAEDSSAQWSMGFAAVEIPYDPEAEYYIAGYQNGLHPNRTPLDLQRVSAVWMDVGGEGILLIGVDCIGLSNKVVNDVRTDLAAFCEENRCASVNIYATHNHAGVDTLGLWGPIAQDGKNDAYMLALTAACGEAAHQAYENRTSGKLYYGSAETEILEDTREPIVYNSKIHQFRFEPDNGSSGIRLVSYASHAESLINNEKAAFVSRDFPGVIADLLMEETGDAFLYMPSAIGGLIRTQDLSGTCGFTSQDDCMYRAGTSLTDSLLSIKNEEEIEPTLALARTELTIPLDNVLFEYYRFLGILDTPAIRGGGETGYSILSELSVLRMGTYTFALIPGEIFPELVSGDYLTSDRAASPENENPAPLEEIAAAHGHENLLILGLANDEIGYIIPPNDYLVHDTLPYFDTADDAYGENHYEETNSVGIRTAYCIADAFEAVLAALGE